MHSYGTMINSSAFGNPFDDKAHILTVPSITVNSNAGLCLSGACSGYELFDSYLDAGPYSMVRCATQCLQNQGASCIGFGIISYDSFTPPAPSVDYTDIPRLPATEAGYDVCAAIASTSCVYESWTGCGADDWKLRNLTSIKGQDWTSNPMDSPMRYRTSASLCVSLAVPQRNGSYYKCDVLCASQGTKCIAYGTADSSCVTFSNHSNVRAAATCFQNETRLYNFTSLPGPGWPFNLNIPTPSPSSSTGVSTFIIIVISCSVGGAVLLAIVVTVTCMYCGRGGGGKAEEPARRPKRVSGGDSPDEAQPDEKKGVGSNDDQNYRINYKFLQL